MNETQTPTLLQRLRRRVWKMTKWTFLCFAVLLAVFLIYDWGSAFWGGPNPRIARETTFITEPLDERGYVDYVEAMNRKLSAGVTPETNAAVPFWRAAGPATIDPADREAYFAALGMEPLPEEGEYYRPFDEFSHWAEPNGLETSSEDDDDANRSIEPEVNFESPKDKEKRIFDQLDRVASNVWSDEEFPAVAAWLDANERAMDLLIEASKRPRWYTPIVKGENFRPTKLIGMTIPEAEISNEIYFLLPVRAMRRFRQGNAAEAWNDAIAQMRLARRLGDIRGMFGLFEGLMAEHAAIDALTALSTREKPTAKMARAWLQSLDELPEPRSLAERIDFEDRFEVLALHCGNLRDLRYALTDDPAMLGPQGDIPGWGKNWVDWNRLLGEMNARYDRYRDAFASPTYRKRGDAAHQIDLALGEWQEKIYELAQIASRRCRERILVHKLTMLTPVGYRLVDTGRERNRAKIELLRVALALRLYAIEHGSYPGELAALAPDYLPEVPADPFTEEPLIYRTTGSEYLLYGLGSFQRDFGGKLQDPENETNGDNIAIRTPGWVDEEPGENGGAEN